MQLSDDWKLIAKHAWSVRLTVLAFLLTVLETALNFVDPAALPIPIPPMTFGILAGLATAAAFVARFVAQKHLKDAK